MIKMMIQFNGKQLTIPINPEELQIGQSASNDTTNIIGLGKVALKGDPDLQNLTIKSFFPGANSYYYTGVYPSTCVKFIQEIWNTENINNNVAKFVTYGLPVDLNMYFVIEDFSYTHKAGEEEDIYFELKIKKYVPYGTKTVKVQLSGLAAARAASPTVTKSNATQTNKTTSNNTYTVVKGDCLWNIAKAASGSGSNWKQLYDLNKSVIGSNPNLIKAGQVLTLPSGWSSITSNKVTKLNSSTTKKSNNNTNVASRVASGLFYGVPTAKKIANGVMYGVPKSSSGGGGGR